MLAAQAMGEDQIFADACRQAARLGADVDDLATFSILTNV